MRRLRAIATAAALIAFAATDAIAAQWPASSRQLGAQEHPRIVAASGGQMKGAVADYVASIGRKLVRHTDRADASWTFTVLDTPVVNAFALPGGYVYVTRGLLALANSEAELAGVLGHEIGHVVNGDGESRQKKNNEVGIGILLGTIIGGVVGGADGADVANQIGGLIGSGYLASYSQQQEFAADGYGVALLARAGYDSTAMARFLRSMQDNDALQDRIAGRANNPNRVDFFATHPATPERMRRATDAARRGSGKRVGAETYLRKIDGIVYGDTPQEGFVRGHRFIHPQLRFAVEVPDGFTMQNSPSQLTATDGRGGRFILTSGQAWDGRMDSYIDRVWLPLIGRQVRLTDWWDLRRVTVHGREAAMAQLEFVDNQGPQRAVILAVRHRGDIYHLIGIAPQGRGRTLNALNTAVQSFRPISSAEAGQASAFRVRVVKVRSGDTIAKLGARMADRRWGVELFRVLNGLGRGESLRAGQLVKLVQ